MRSLGGEDPGYIRNHTQNPACGAGDRALQPCHRLWAPPTDLSRLAWSVYTRDSSSATHPAFCLVFWEPLAQRRFGDACCLWTLRMVLKRTMHASSATVGETESHLYKAGTSLTGIRRWSQIPSHLPMCWWPCVPTKNYA